MDVLDSVVVSTRRNMSMLSTINTSHVIMDMGRFSQMPQILGSSDPMRILQMLPGVQTTGEFEGGLHIQGSDNGHNEVQIEGVPLYNPNHLFNLFSSLNPTHFKSLELKNNGAVLGSTNRLGAVVDMKHSLHRPDSLSLDLSLGMVELTASLRVPVGKRSWIAVSPRASFLTLLYPHLFKIHGQNGNGLKYYFSDFDASFFHMLKNGDLLIVDGFYGGDNAFYDSGAMQFNANGAWSNNMQAVHWKRDRSEYSLSQKLYRTEYRTFLMFDMNVSQWSMGASLQDIGYKGEFKKGVHTAFLNAAWHIASPQSRLTGGELIKPEKESAIETSLGYDAELSITPRLHANLGVQGNFYLVHGKLFPSLDPCVSLTYRIKGNEINLSCYRRHQYLFKTGFSNTGLPTEYWMLCNDIFKPQYVDAISLSSSHELFDGKYILSAEAYYKNLGNQYEYSGNFLDIVESDYNIDNKILAGKGWNYGVSVSLNKVSGQFTGWVGYSYGRALREFHQGRYDGVFPASHERPHELNVVANYKLGRKWSLNGTFVFASGNPYTAPEQFYYVNGSMLTNFSELNAHRLNAYSRLDLSATFLWKARKIKADQKIILSAYNVLCHRNELGRIIYVENQKFWLDSFSFIDFILPSISYSISF